MSGFLEIVGMITVLLFVLYVCIGGFRYWMMLRAEEARKTWKDALRIIFLWPLSFWVA